MKAIIMAGGFGTRLRPLSINVPKPMVPIGNLPMMHHVVNSLKAAGIADMTSLLYFQPEVIRNYFGDGSKFGVSMTYAQPDDDFGTAGAVRYALPTVDEPVLIISGDVVTDFDLAAAVDWHRSRQADATIVLTRAENPLAYGIVITDDEGKIVRFLEKPTWGEAFSDTINTGIYILEPSAIEMIPQATNFDFSQNLFPSMLQKKMGLYGNIMPGYWKDVGNVDEYHRVHQDLFTGSLRLNLGLEAEKIGSGTLYRAPGVDMPDSVEIDGTVILGTGCKVGLETKLENCVLGNRSAIGNRCDISDTIIWDHTTIGDTAKFSGVIVGSNVTVGRDVQALDDSILSDESQIGEQATIRANCRIWPGKTVDEGAIVSRSLVWGEKWSRELFTDSKVTGIALTELTPEMTVRIGSAIGAMLGANGRVVTSRDASDISRLLRRGVIAGLLATGVDVSDLGTTPMPVLRYGLRQGQYDAGIYVRHNPEDWRQVDIICIDSTGLDIPPAKQKKIERNYFGEDYPLASIEAIGHLDAPGRVLDDYRSTFLKEIDIEVIRNAEFNIVIDHSNGASAEIFPELFTRLGVTVTELNASLNPRRFSIASDSLDEAIRRMSAIVTSVGADLGLIINPPAEKMTIIDEAGAVIDPHLLLLMVTDLYVQLNRPERIAVPVGASMGVEEIAKQYGVEVLRVAGDHRAMMDVRLKGIAEFVGGTRGGFIFPGFQTASDAMIGAVHILELLARTGQKLETLRQKFARFNWDSTSVPCPWSKRGTVMRQLITSSSDKERQLIDGVRVFEDNGWVLISPDRFRASFNIMAESTDAGTTERLLSHYRGVVESCQNGDD